LAPEDRVEFERAAAADKERYKKEMAAYKEECKALKRKQTQTQKETIEKKQKLESNRSDPKVIQRSAEHRSETITSQVAPSFAHCTENPSVNSRDGVGNTGHYSWQLP
jgi:sulfite reductase alpha subunit-like flavoprotein